MRFEVFNWAFCEVIALWTFIFPLRSPSVDLLTAASSMPSRRDGLCTWAPKTPSSRPTTGASRTSSRTSSRSKTLNRRAFRPGALDCFLPLLKHNSQTNKQDTVSSFSIMSHLTTTRPLNWTAPMKCLIIISASGSTSRSLTSWRSGMNTVSLMTWWPRFWSPLGDLFGPARITMEMCSQTFWLRVSAL